jgi:uncharacterized protein YdbL (DUF1318 family)
MTIDRRVLVLAAVLVTLPACLTINVYFPAPEIREAAEQIVTETWGDGGAAAPQPTGQPQSRRGTISDLLMPAAAYADDVDIDVSTAAIRKLKTSIAGRSGELKPYLRDGKIGIGKDGLLAIRDLGGVPLRDQANVRRLVDAENRDRTSLYRAIAEANDLDASRVADIQKIFADTWIEKAETGWPIQKPDGSWTTR